MTEHSEPVLPVPVRILVVDDNPAMLQLIASFLESSRFHLTCAGSIEEGLRAFLAEIFDIVISDRALSSETGGQLAAEIKRRNPSVPIVLITAGHPALPFDTTPFTAFLPSPFSRTQLITTVEDVLPMPG